jgi:plastocyanin
MMSCQQCCSPSEVVPTDPGRLLGGGVTALLLTALLLAACGGSGGAVPDLEIVAEDLGFDTDRLQVPAGGQVTIQVVNKDQAVLHNFHVTDAPGEPATRLEAGPNSQNLTLRIDAVGTYTFICDTHPGMTGVLEVSEDRNQP